MQIKSDKKPVKPHKLTEELVTEILDKIRNNMPNKHAAISSGLSERQFYYCLKQGELDLEDGIVSLYARMVQSLAKIEAEEIQWCRREIKSNPKSHFGAQWTLEHVYWRHFGASAQIKELEERLLRLEQQKGLNDE